MICKNCKESMDEVERGEDDGLVTVINKCPSCKWSVKRWIQIEPEDAGFGDNESWLDENEEAVD